MLITYGMVVGCKATGQYFQSAELSDKTKVIVTYIGLTKSAVQSPIRSLPITILLLNLMMVDTSHMLAFRGELLFRFLGLKKGR